MKKIALSLLVVLSMILSACSDTSSPGATIPKESAVAAAPLQDGQQGGAGMAQAPVAQSQAPSHPQDSGFNPWLAGAVGYMLGSSMSKPSAPQVVQQPVYVNRTIVVQKPATSAVSTPKHSTSVSAPSASVASSKPVTSASPTTSYRPVAPSTTTTYSYRPSTSTSSYGSKSYGSSSYGSRTYGSSGSYSSSRSSSFSSSRSYGGRR